MLHGLVCHVQFACRTTHVAAAKSMTVLSTCQHKMARQFSLSAQHQSPAFASEHYWVQLDLERRLRGLLTKEKDKAEEQAALAMGLCTGAFSLP